MSRLPRHRIAPARLAAIAVILAIAVAGVIAFSSQAAAAGVSCGDTITRDTTLHHDLVNCPNNGLLIGADHVTLNLNGHTIDGNGKFDEGCDVATEFCDVGVVDFRHDGVTIKNGTLRQFGGGVNIYGAARHTRLIGISARNNADVGIQLYKVSHSQVRDSSANGTLSDLLGLGLAIYSSREIRIVGNSFRRNAGDAVHIVDSNDNVLKRNRSSHNGGEAVLLENGNRNRVIHNREVRNGAGITIGPGIRNVVRRNHVAGGRDGIRIEKGHGNLVARNTVVATKRVGIRLGIKNPFLGGARNTVRGNLVKKSHRDGYVILSKDGHSLLEDNIARRSRDDGFDIGSHSATLTDNRANGNGDLGIEAVRTVNDGGGNTARHNGDTRECKNIACG